MLSILKLDSILLTLLSTVIRVSFPLSLSQKGICSSIVYHKTLHLYYKFPYYEKRTHNLLRCHCHSNLPPLHFRCLPLRLTIFLTTLYHCDTIFCDTLQGLQDNHQIPSIPCKSSISTTFGHLIFLYDLKNIKLQIIRLICCPEYWMIWSLCPELNLTKSLMHI